MTQPPPYPGQPEYPGQPGQPVPGWPPPPGQEPFAPPTSAPPTSGQPYAAPYPPTGQIPATGAFGQPTSQFPPPTGQFPTGPVPQPFSGPPASGPPFAGPPPGYPMYPQAAPPKKGRGLMITLIVVVVLLVLGGGGGAAAYFVMQNNEGTGQPTPVEAVNGFLTAVYKNKSSAEALKFVCPTSRDKDKLAARVDEIRRFDAGLSSPTYTWPAPTVEKQDTKEATLVVPVKVTTTDEKVSETKYKYLATHGKGWWVCEITAA
ncbi:Rv0361 family membrane protein [Dactylosporangium sp. CA-092794]|uniref:Rv0361 family membrane protein n=1 Tax=Dactylosporangium sp. CA-092794 TaxID=3239929 RepID=UPI003D8EFC62